MTEPVVLYGTQSNGETLPIQVDEFGRLVAEGLPGSEGPPGPPGGAFPLPADPYEGALLGWLNGGLAWVSEPAVILPEGLFGPIISYEDGVVVVEGSIPPEVQNGVYLKQVDKENNPYNPLWNQDENWSDYCSTDNTLYSNWSIGFDGSTGTFNRASGRLEFNLPSPLNTSNPARIYVGTRPSSVDVNGTRAINTDGTPQWSSFNVPGGQISSIQVQATQSSSYDTGWSAIEVDGRILCDQNVSQNIRVNTVLNNNTFIGVPGPTDHMTVGAYLRMPAQKVAPWVYFAGRPEARIDHMQRLSGLVTTTDIDLLR